MNAKPEVAAGQRWARMDDDGEYIYYSVVEVTPDRVVYGAGQGSMPREQFAQGDGWIFCGHDGPGILPPYSTAPAVALGCAHSANPTVLPMDYELDTGFGYVTVYRDGETILAAMGTDLTLAQVEQWAQQDPGDWRLRLEGALSERLYQRQDAGWVLVARGMGFA